MVNHWRKIHKNGFSKMMTKLSNSVCKVRFSLFYENQVIYQYSYFSITRSHGTLKTIFLTEKEIQFESICKRTIRIFHTLHILQWHKNCLVSFSKDAEKKKLVSNLDAPVTPSWRYVFLCTSYMAWDGIIHHLYKFVFLRKNIFSNSFCDC